MGKLILHSWQSFRDWFCCENCGLVQNQDNKSKACKGRVKITLREP